MNGRSVSEADAVGWLIRQRDPRFDDWEALTNWLEADPDNAASYARLADLDAGLAEDLTRRPPEPLSASNRWRRHASPRAWSAVAAVMVILLAGLSLFFLLPERGSRMATGRQIRRVQLADGSRMILAAQSSVRLDAAQPRTIRLDRGEVYFDVRHDAARPFRVLVDGGQAEDLGTRFTVRHDAQTTTLAVAEGAVAFVRGGRHVRLAAGDRLSARGDVFVRDRVPVDRIADWASSRLEFDNADLATVALQLSRVLGAPVTVRPGARGPKITATIQLDADVDRSMQRLGPLLGIRVARNGDGWVLAPAA